MPTDLTVILPNRPGTIADMGEAAAKADVNIEGVCGFPSEGQGVLHVLIDDAAAARAAFEAAGLQVTGEREVLVLEVEHRPGTLGELMRRIADAGVNVDLLYVANGNRLVIGADDPEKARAAL